MFLTKSNRVLFFYDQYDFSAINQSNPCVAPFYYQHVQMNLYKHLILLRF